MQTKSSIGYIVVDDKDQDVIYYHYRDNGTGGEASDGLPSVESSHLLLESLSCNRNSKSYTKRFKQTLGLKIVFGFCLLSFVTIVCDKYVFRINICKQLYEMVCEGFAQKSDGYSDVNTDDNNLLMSSYESAVTVQTDCVQIVGSIEENAFVFKGIPYALPPTGTRRWSRPQTLLHNSYKKGYFRANHFSSDCLQYNSTINQMVGEEDCLYLNVWTPRIDDQANLNVLVYIHGGLAVGSAYRPIRPNGQLARKLNVVFVSINYRLSAMGFLALDLLANANANSSHANYGLWDVWEGLQWIRHNIRPFGGHPNKLTLFGSDGQLIIGLLSNSLYANIIRNVWIVGSNRMQTKQKFSLQSQYFRNCFLMQTKCSTVSCLQSMDAKNVLHIYHNNCMQDAKNLSRLVYDDEILYETSTDEMSKIPVFILSDTNGCLSSDVLSNISSKLFSYCVRNIGSSEEKSGLDRNQLVLNSMFEAIDQSFESISQNIRQFGDELLDVVIAFINERYDSMQSFNASIINCQTP